MDVISWVVGLVAGYQLRSLRLAMIIGTLTSIAIRVYQFFLPGARKWGTEMPEDLIGALLAGIGVTLALAWLGSALRKRLKQRRAPQDAVR